MSFDRDVVISQNNEYEILQLMMGDCRERLSNYPGMPHTSPPLSLHHVRQSSLSKLGGVAIQLATNGLPPHTQRLKEELTHQYSAEAGDGCGGRSPSLELSGMMEGQQRVCCSNTTSSPGRQNRSRTEACQSRYVLLERHRLWIQSSGVQDQSRTM